ncbi:MAG: hypothetical protein ACHBMF_08015, partial [Chromatiales bacterium]
MHIRVVLVLLSLLCQSLGTEARPLRENEIPPSLAPWVPWVLYEERDRECPFIHNQPEARRCAWPSRLVLKIDQGEGEFIQFWRVYRESWIGLPGDLERWPQEVQVDGQPASVTEREGRPGVSLPPGRYQITGRWRWERLPESLYVPPDTALVSLIVNEIAVSWPDIRPDGQLWLKQQAGKTALEERLEIQVFRRIIDEVPLELLTRLEIDVAGEPRELMLSNALLPEFIPLGLSSALPARLEPDGRLRLQLRPGHWAVELSARAPGAVSTLHAASPTDPWPRTETWVFDARNHLRLVEIQGLTAIDPRQTNVPPEWQSLPAYRIGPADVLEFKLVRRGDPDPAPDRLGLVRNLWLDMEGSGYTVRDLVSGTMTRGWRLEAGDQLHLGRVAIDAVPQFITTLPDSNRPGVEVRRGALNLDADSRYEGDVGRFPAVGWNQDVQSLQATLHLPPGWRLFAAAGSDDVSASWVERWTLLELFLVIIAALATARLWHWRWGLAMLAGLALIWHEADAPQFIWLHLLAANALVRVLPAGRFLALARGYRNVSAAILLLIAIPFAIEQVRLGLYPQLERPGPVQPVMEVSPAAPPEAATVSQPMEGVAGGRVDSSDAPMSVEKMRERAEQKGDRMVRRLMEEADAPKLTARVGVLGEVDPKARVQTGPGRPEWRWNEIALRWNGPVEHGQEVRLVLLSPAMNLGLSLARVILLLVLCARMIVPFATTWGAGTPMAKTPVLLVLAYLFAPVPEARAEYPSAKLLEQLRQRLLAPPECLPNCAQSPRMYAEIAPAAMRLRIEIHAAESVSVPLPAQAGQWLPQEILVDSQPATDLARTEGGEIWVHLEPGRHELLLSGSLPPRPQLQLPLPLRPHRVEVRAEGWRVDGVHENGVPDAQIQLTRTASTDDLPVLESSPLPSFARVERTLRLGLDWRAETTVTRISPTLEPVVIEVPLLAGESVTTPNVRVKDNKVLVSLDAQRRSVRWDSVLEHALTFGLTAPETTQWIETWRADVSPIWHLAVQGIAVVHHQDPSGRWLPEWRPWPGESITLGISRPAGVSGPTMTVQNSRLTVSAGERAIDATLDLTLESSQGGQHTLTLPEAARLQQVTIGGAAQPIRQQGRRVTLPVVPGTQRFQLLWREPRGMETRFLSPEVDLGLPSVNHYLKVTLGNDRWLLLSRGPRLGPAVLIWGVLGVLVLVAYGLGRTRITPLKGWHWFLLGIGLSQASIWGALIVVGWLLALGARAQLNPAIKPYAFDALQLGLGVLTVLALSCLFDAIQNGLLGYPEMQVAGNGSSAYDLNWYQDRSDPALPQAEVWSVPLSAYRLLMLAWALWLAYALLGWLRWGWGCYSTHGLWRSIRPRIAE